MAIIGVGIDIADISRVAGAIARYGGKFVDRVYTPLEADFCSRAAVPGVHFAGRWSAKEAFYKALPRAAQQFSGWRSIQIVSGADGRPSVEVCCGRLRQALSDAGATSIHLSITHERTHCAAVVVLESGC